MPNRITNDEFLYRFNKINSDFELLSEYENMRTRIKVKCKKCGEISYVMPRKLLSNTGCLNCKNSGQKLNKVILDRKLKEKFGDKFEILSEVNGRKEKVLIKCKDCGYEWWVVPWILYTNQKDCPNCSRLKRYSSLDSIKEKIKEVHGDSISVIGDYNGYRSGLMVRCNNCGYEWKANVTNIISGKGCPNRCYMKCRLINLWKDELENMYSKSFNILYPEKFYGDSTEITLVCKNCGNTINGPIEYLRRYIRKCRTCNPISSSYEDIVYDFISENYNGVIERNKRFTDYRGGTSREIDIYIPEFKLAIEVDGLYWHSYSKVGSNKQKDKLEYFKNYFGIRVIFIRSDEIDHKFNIIKDKILYLLKSKNIRKIPARKLIIKEVPNNIKDLFLDKYHIQGKDTSSINLGLWTKNGKLISVITFGVIRSKSEFDKNNKCIELIRYCSRIGCNVQGGFSRLLKHISEKLIDLGYNYIKTYSDRRFSEGKLYESNDFVLKNISNPNYVYFNNVGIYNRLVFQKHKLSSLLENFDESLSEYENMRNNGYERYYDCGNLVYYKKL